MKRFTTFIACMITAVALVPLPGAAQDLATTAGKNIKVLLENEKVRVLELQMAPGEKTGMHSHGDNIVYFLSGGEATQTGEDGTSKTMQPKAGEILWSAPVTHDTENTGQSPVKALIIELKESPEAP